jgi:hypothetical protein
MLLKFKLTNSECILMPYVLQFCLNFSSERPVTIYHVLKLFQHGQPADPNALLLQAVLRIRIHMFLGHPDPLVRGIDPDPSIIVQK